MKKKLYIAFTFLSFAAFGQSNDGATAKDEDYGLYISAGVHLGLWNLVFGSFTNTNSSSQKAFSWDQVPCNIHVDKLFKKNYVLGIGYAYDKYVGNPLTTGTSAIAAIRQNISLRFYKYLRDPRKTFSIYLGFSAGASNWKTVNNPYKDVKISQEWWPTAQFIFGMKINFSETFFSQTEFCAGPPYACQTSLGIKF